RASLDFPMRPRATTAQGGLGISRFPCEVSPYVLGVSDRAGLWYTSRYRCTRWSLPHTPTASASRSECLSRLNTRPARSPVNASTPPSRAAPHDSGPMWVANPLSCDFFIHYNLAGLTGAQELHPMNTEMQKRALAAREAHLALLDLKKVVDEATQTTHAAELEAVHLAIRARPIEETSTS